MKLTEEEIWYFKHNGFRCLPECLPDDLVDRLNAVTDEQIDRMIEPVVWEKRETRTPGDVRRLSKIIARDPVYLEAASHPIIAEALEGILGSNIELLTNKHNHIMVRARGRPRPGVGPFARTRRQRCGLGRLDTSSRRALAGPMDHS